MKNTTPTNEFETHLSLFLGLWKDRIDADYAKNFSNLTPPVLVTYKGRKFIKVVREEGTRGHRSVAAFISMEDGTHMGAPVKVGDILKPASWASPAKHSRGNIFVPGFGMNSVTTFGVNYL